MNKNDQVRGDLINNPDQKRITGYTHVKAERKSPYQAIQRVHHQDWGEVLLLDGDPQVAQYAYRRYQQGLLGLVLASEWEKKGQRKGTGMNHGLVLGGGDGLFRVEMEQWRRVQRGKSKTGKRGVETRGKKIKQGLHVEAVEWDRDVIEEMQPVIARWIKPLQLGDLVPMPVNPKTGGEGEGRVCIRPFKQGLDGQYTIESAWDWIDQKKDNQQGGIYDWIAVDLIDPQEREWGEEVLTRKMIKALGTCIHGQGVVVWQMGSGSDWPQKQEWKKSWNETFRWSGEWTIKGELQDQVFWVGGHSLPRQRDLKKVIRQCQLSAPNRRQQGVALECSPQGWINELYHRVHDVKWRLREGEGG